MRPVRLVVEGFTSFRSPQEVDFSELELFVITGATGSGKSSILDAVTLALYGNVPRTNKHELKELISLGASQAKVQLDFEVDRTLYRVARRLPKNGAQVATVERVEDGEAISEVDSSRVTEANARIEEIVGLDYEAFTRAVLLPQGAFAEFLNGNASKRKDILIKLLDFDRFLRAGQRANQEAKALDHEVTASEQVLASEYEGVDEEAIDEAKGEAKKARKQAEAVERANREAKERWDDREEVRRKLESVEEVTNKLRGQASALSELEERWSRLSEKDAETRGALEGAKKALDAADDAHRKAKVAWTKVTEEVGDDALLAELAETAKTLADSEQKIEATSAELEETEKGRGQASEEREQLAERMEAAQESENEARAEVEKATAAVGSVREALDRAKRRASLDQQLEEQRERLVALQAELDEAEAAEKSAEKKLNEATQRLDALETEHRAAALRSHLHVGDDCPVCGSEVGELPETDPDTESELEDARRAREEWDRKLKEAGRAASAHRSTIEGVEDNIRRIEKEDAEIGGAPSPSDAEDAVEEAEKQEREAGRRLASVVEEAEDARSELSEHDRALARLEGTLSEARLRLGEMNDTAERCRARLVEALGDPMPDEVAKVIADRQDRLKDAASAMRSADEALDEARKSFDEAAANRAAFEGELKDLDGGIRSQGSLLSDRRDALSRFLEEEAPELPPEDAAGREERLSGLKKYRDVLHGLAEDAGSGCKEAIEEVDSGLVGLLSAAGVEHEKDDLESALSALGERAGDARLQAERSKDTVQQLQDRLARKQEMTKELTEKRSQMRLYEKVGRELRMNRFINFLLEESFQDLALRASNELEQISDGRYSLAASGDSFTVVDHANADERRSVVTLSGGETFLASLALALALAQGITDIAGHSAAARLESMFIDEGFGTLDPTALDLAVEALERLREGERMVGVITHVPALAERIPAGIAVEKKGGGSVVEMR